MALGIIAMATMQAIGDTLASQQRRELADALPVWQRWVIGACWILVAVDLVGRGRWPLALGPIFFALLAGLAGPIHTAAAKQLAERGDGGGDRGVDASLFAVSETPQVPVIVQRPVGEPFGYQRAGDEVLPSRVAEGSLPGELIALFPQSAEHPDEELADRRRASGDPSESIGADRAGEDGRWVDEVRHASGHY